MIETLNSLGISNGMITSAAITIVLCVLSVIAGRRLQTVPSGLQNFAEWAIESLYRFFGDIMGERTCKRYFPLIATLFIYILVCNYSGLLPASGHIPGLTAPTSSINCTAAMAIIVFVMIQISGIRSHHGVRYYKHWFQPFALDVYKRQDVLIPGIMEHIERTGVHSGDSISVYPHFTLSKEVEDTLIDYTKRITKALHITGLVNIQYAYDGKMCIRDSTSILRSCPRNQGVFVMLDVDDFKLCNDKYGHLLGDEVLTAIGKWMEREFPDGLLAHYGGDEFTVFLDKTVKEREEFSRRMEKALLALRQDPFLKMYEITVSAGIAFRKDEQMFEELYRYADQALYEAKENGKNSFLIAGESAGL